jgi:prolycopene isomerase
MNIRRESKSESYDAVVVGSGIGGLTAAALLGHVGRKVLVVERHDRLGGYAHSFRRKKYHFDAAVHLIGGCHPSTGLVDSLLRLLDVRDKCDFVEVDPFYTAVFPGLRLDAPLGVDAFIEAHLRHFPHEERGLRELMQVCSQLRGEVFRLPTRLSFWDMLQTPRRYPAVYRYHKATLGRVLDNYLTDTRLKAAFSALWPYLGLPPSKLSFLYWALMLTSYLEEGAYYCRDTFQNLADAFAASLQANGGEILLGTPVRRIVVKNRRATGVVLENGQKIEAKIVISNADARQTFEELIGAGELPKRYMTKLQRMTPSLSAFVVYMATDLDMAALGAGHEMFFYRSWDHEQTYRSILEGKPAGIGLTVPTLVDAALAPAGQHIVTVTSLIPYQTDGSWRDQKTRYADALQDEITAVFPDLTDHILFAEGASPRTMERYTLNATGSIYGWQVSPDQVGRNRLPNKTPIAGLYLAGHWTQPGGGIYGVIVSGLQTAQAVLGFATTEDLFTAFAEQRGEPVAGHPASA